MGGQMSEKVKKRVCVGLLAHVDAGKTTLSEGLLYLSGKIKKLGRVDKRDTFLDTHELERERGITIFSKQARLSCGSVEITLLDTPGHVDFSAEMERTLQVLDCAVLVISGTDGVQAHTETLWNLLGRYNIPTFVFVTKMDLLTCDKSLILGDMRSRLGGNFIDFGADTQSSEFEEELAVCDELLLEKYMDIGKIFESDISQLVKRRKMFPGFFGSGLKLDGVENLLSALGKYAPEAEYGDKFAAKVYKIARDNKGGRLTYLKITGGSLNVRETLKYHAQNSAEETEEKITQIRLYSGEKFEAAETVSAGSICAVTGLTKTYPGQGLGEEANSFNPFLEPVLSYRIALPDGCDVRAAIPKLKQLEDEDPTLHIVWNDRHKEINALFMGQVQIEILKSLIKSRFDIDAEINSGKIMYKETIDDKVEGIGHFEPLRHYAEVHLVMEPLETGSGLVFDSVCGEDVLDRNWQRLILSHLEEKPHLGVLTGSPITDMKITLVSGRAHIKHTEGGDFRQATYRAVRQGLMRAKSVLLEPFYSFRLDVPAEQGGRAINDIRRMSGEFVSELDEKGSMIISGTAPVATMENYISEVYSYTHGKGKLNCVFCGYKPCHNEAEAVKSIGYDPESDIENTADSVFCAHGGGFNVKWNKVEEYMHLEPTLKRKGDSLPNIISPRTFARNLNIDDKELEAIMEREFGPIKRPEYRASGGAKSGVQQPAYRGKKEYLIIDGYNMIFAWDGLKELAFDGDLENAREKLMEVLSNYRGYTKCELVLVFDAYKVKGNTGKKFDYHNIHVVFTKEGETGDMYIEKLVSDIGKNFSVRVATSDSLIRLSALRSGVLRMSADELLSEIERVNDKITEIIKALEDKK